MSHPYVPHSAARHTERLRTMQLMAFALMGALLMIGVALLFVLDVPEELTSTDLAVTAVQVVAGLVLHSALRLTYRAVRPIPPGTPRVEARRLALAAYQATMPLRFALSEVVAIVSIAAAFVLPHGSLLTYATGALVSLVLMWRHVWPQERTVELVRERLDEQGGRSYLRELMGLDPWTGSPEEPR